MFDPKNAADVLDHRRYTLLTPADPRRNTALNGLAVDFTSIEEALRNLDPGMDQERFEPM